MTRSLKKRQRIVLASASPRRLGILRGLGLHVTVNPSTKPEAKWAAGEPASDYALRAAQEKALDVGGKYTSGLVIGADTVVVVGKRILGKPKSKSEARRMLQSLAGRWHKVITGIYLIYGSDRSVASTCSISRVHFRELTEAEIAWYLKKDEYRDKAGAYAVQGLGSTFVDRIDGCYFNVVGFPVAAFVELCNKIGVPLFSLD